MASRRIVKVRKTALTTTTTSNPFASIQLVPPADTSTTPAVTTTEAGSGTRTSKESEESNDQSEATKKEETDDNTEVDHEKETDENSKLPESKSDESKVDVNVDKEKVENPNGGNEPESTEKKAGESEKIKNDTEAGTVVEKSANGTEVKGNKMENEEEKQVGDGKNEKGAEAASFVSFQHLSSSQNAFTGLAGTGFSNTTFSSFGASSKEGSPLGFGSESGACSGSLFGLKSDQSFFGLSLPTNGNASGSSSVKKSEGTGFPSIQEVPVETGEEYEKAIFTADSVLFEYLNGGWKGRAEAQYFFNWNWKSYLL